MKEGKGKGKEKKRSSILDLASLRCNAKVAVLARMSRHMPAFEDGLSGPNNVMIPISRYVLTELFVESSSISFVIAKYLSNAKVSKAIT